MASVLVAISIPVILVSTGVRSVALSESFYRAEFAKYAVGRSTSLTEPQLHTVAQAFIAYFQAPPGPMNVEMATDAGTVPLFSRRELDHMVDVQVLVRGFIDAWAAGSLAFVLGGIALLRNPSSGLRSLARASAIGGAGAVLAVAALSLLVVVDFRQIFLQFHFLSFTNDLWVLDPSRDRLIQLYPLGFFFDAALHIAAHITLFGATILGISLVAIRWLRPG